MISVTYSFIREIVGLFYWLCLPGGLDGSSCSLPCGESIRGLFGSSLTGEPGLFAWELDSSDVIGPGVSIRMCPMCVM